MDSKQRRKRKHQYWPYSLTTLLLCLSFFLFLSLGRLSIRSGSFKPVLTTTIASSLLSTTSRQDSVHGGLALPFRVEGRVLFPDHLLLVVSTRLDQTKALDCVYYRDSGGSTELVDEEGEGEAIRQPVLSVDDYDGLRSIARCPIPAANFSAAAAVTLRRREDVDGIVVGAMSKIDHYKVHSWERMVYEAVVDGNTAVVFAKGLNLRPHKESDPTEFKCQFGLGKWDEEKGYAFVTEAVAAAQELVRCLLPRSIRKNPDKAQGIQVTIVQAAESGRGGGSHGPMASAGRPHRRNHGSEKAYTPMPSLAKLYNPRFEKHWKKQEQYELCVCTMLWNQAAALKEWVMYHSWLGVQRWFIYDNNSDDGIQQVIDELELQDYNVSRHTWPWIKTQEAGFSHCALRAKDECKWVGFFDVDEFFYFPGRHRRGSLHQNSLRSLVHNLSSSRRVAEIRTACHSFGPSGLRSPPLQGVMAGYTCRLQSPERHKSIVRPALLNETLLNVVHHFQLREGYSYFNVGEDVAVINHYKYQVWETFRAKFYRRVATYVADWQEHQNEGSKDRAPGLGTEAIEPPNWRRQFCEVWDTGLRDVVLANFADQATGSLPWENAL